MTIKEAKSEVERIARLCAYGGVLSDAALSECASVYLSHLTNDGEPSPRTYHRASNHRRSNLNEIQWLLVNTPSFKRWFGKSVVVDENGEPKLMYHGSSREFNEFKPEAIKVSKSRMTLWAGPGFYFTDKRSVAVIYAKGNDPMDVFIRLENPLKVDETGNAESAGDGITKSQAAAIILAGDNAQWLDVTLASELNRMDVSDGVKPKGKGYYKGLTRRKRVEEFVSRLRTDVVKLKCVTSAYGSKSQKRMMANICKETGHDGVIHKIAPDVVEWVVYEPSAIKSATDNDGSFSSSATVVQDSFDADLPSSGQEWISSLIDSLHRIAASCD